MRIVRIAGTCIPMIGRQGKAILFIAYAIRGRAVAQGDWRENHGSRPCNFSYFFIGRFLISSLRVVTVLTSPLKKPETLSVDL